MNLRFFRPWFRLEGLCPTSALTTLAWRCVHRSQCYPLCLYDTASASELAHVPPCPDLAQTSLSFLVVMSRCDGPRKNLSFSSAFTSLPSSHKAILSLLFSCVFYSTAQCGKIKDALSKTSMKEILCLR